MREAQPTAAVRMGIVMLLVLIAAASVLLDWAERHYGPINSSRVERLMPPPPGLRPEATLVSDPALLAPLTPEQAKSHNSAVAVTSDPMDPAQAFGRGSVPSGDAARALDCLTAAVYYEADSESDVGQRAVAQVVLNRVRHAAFPHTVCGVVFQGAERRTGCQFSFTCDGSLRRRPSARGWARARIAAAMLYNGYVERSVGSATHYHTISVLPYWSPKLVKLTTVGAHIFLRWPGDWGRPAAFEARYEGREPAVGKGATRLTTERSSEYTVAHTTAPADPLPQTWDRPLLRPGVPIETPRNDGPVVGSGERRILGIDMPLAGTDGQRPLVDATER